MGLPLGKLIAATNENNVLDEFFRTGKYRVRKSAETLETTSPSMDISKASNFERFVFDLMGRDAAKTAALMQDVAKRGGFDLSGSPEFDKAAKQYGFVSGASNHAHRMATIRDVAGRYGVVIDTHTADGVKVAREHLRTVNVNGETVGVPMLVLETALPAKFAETIEQALNAPAPRPAGFEGLEDLPKRFDVMEASAATMKAYIQARV
jgi:threonine synthase